LLAKENHADNKLQIYQKNQAISIFSILLNPPCHTPSPSRKKDAPSKKIDNLGIDFHRLRPLKLKNDLLGFDGTPIANNESRSCLDAKEQ
jgi:hypothetical protein